MAQVPCPPTPRPSPWVWPMFRGDGSWLARTRFVLLLGLLYAFSASAVVFVFRLSEMCPRGPAGLPVAYTRRCPPPLEAKGVHERASRSGPRAGCSPSAADDQDRKAGPVAVRTHRHPADTVGLQWPAPGRKRPGTQHWEACLVAGASVGLEAALWQRETGVGSTTARRPRQLAAKHGTTDSERPVGWPTAAKGLCALL